MKVDFLIESHPWNDLKKESMATMKMPAEFPSISPEKIPSTFPELSIPLKYVLTLLAYGYNTKEIADLLKVSPKTIEYHRMNLFRLFHTNSIAVLTRIAIKMGLVKD